MHTEGRVASKGADSIPVWSPGGGADSIGIQGGSAHTLTHSSLLFSCGAMGVWPSLTFPLPPSSSSQVWRDDRLVFERERAAGAYGTAAYFSAVVLFDFLPLRCGSVSVNI